MDEEALMGHLRTFFVGFGPTRRIAAAFGTLALLLLVAIWVGYTSYAQAQELVAVSRQDRKEALTAERTLAAFWRERESIGEYRLLPSNALAREARLRQRAFEKLATQRPGRSASPEVRQEASLYARSLKANAALVAISTAAQLDPRHSRAARKAFQKLDAATASVLRPLLALHQLNQGQYRAREARARSASRRAMEIELATALLALALVAWFAIFASGLVKRIERQNVALRATDELKDQLINTVSHELRTPLTSIQGYLELLLDTESDGADPLTDEQRRFLRTVTRSSDRLLNLVNDLLLVAQARAGRLEMKKLPCDLLAIANQAVESARASATKNNIALSLRPLSARAVVNADAGRLGQAIDNLISNAIKFTPVGGSIDVAVSQLDGHASITITDTGAGMTAAEINQLFERFYRTQSATEGNIQGTGLGLAITKSIVEAHDGTIDVISEPGSGTTFTISLATDDGTRRRRVPALRKAPTPA
jgi:signal transduction histidine kinase